MKIAFLTSSLEAGRDGVGDYTRLLAAECQRQGHECRMIGLNDPFVEIEKREAPEGIKTLRFGIQSPLEARIETARPFISEFAPDWCSLQFVCYGFHPKGIAPRLAKSLKELIGRVHLHIMFHELWIGSEVGATWNHRLTGAVQKFFVLDLLRKLSPACVQTSNSAYIHLLGQEAVHASLLPLFGSVPIREECESPWIFEELQKCGSSISKANRRDFWLFGFFGTLHPGWPPEPLFSFLREGGRRNGKKIILITMGRLGPGQALWNLLRRDYSQDFTFCNLGEQLPESISEILNTVDFGIAATPYVIIGKSATVAAMLEHGLPVIVNRDELRFLGYLPKASGSPLIIKIDAQLPDKLATARRARPKSIRSSVAKQFLETLHGI